jgi:hypothetical protein
MLQGFRSIAKASMDGLTVRREEEIGKESRGTVLIYGKKGSIARGFSNMAHGCGISRCQSSQRRIGSTEVLRSVMQEWRDLQKRLKRVWQRRERRERLKVMAAGTCPTHSWILLDGISI